MPAELIDALVRDLRRIPELFAQLDVTITRTDITRPRGEGTPGSGHDRPLILNDYASDRRHDLLRTLRYAAAVVPYAPRALSPKDAALDILEDLPRASRGPGAEKWVRGLLGAITKAWGAVDAPASVEIAGYCEGCGTTVAGPSYLRVLKCRRCGTEHQARLYREWMREAADEYTGTAAELARLLPHFEGAPVKAATIRKWHERGKLIGCVEQRGTTFRVGDVLALHRAQRAKLRPVPRAA
ncbi:hypothetical protein [Nocardia wallacei]|uniref:hypothetical protein n=1 Tax=Nocardia wallacei TaxID=480035 RepID=UPI002453D1DC|nr:hypothetical protein [Nocardia wallacei]